MFRYRKIDVRSLKCPKIRRATGPGRVRARAPIPSPCSLFPSGTGLQFWSPVDTIYGVLGEGGWPGIRRIKLYNLFLAKLRNWLRNWSLFESLLGANMGPSWLRKSTKIDEKSMPRCLPMLTSFFIGFWSVFGPVPTSTARTWKIEPPLQREHDFSKNRFSQVTSIFDWFWC